jgi:hypothetical protein
VQSLQHHHQSSRGRENGVIGIPLYVFVILILGIIMLFGVVAFTLMFALGLPSSQEQTGSTGASDSAAAAAVDKTNILASRIITAGLLGFVWLFVWMVAFRVLDPLYRESVQFNPTNPYRMVWISLMISLSVLCAVLLITRLVVWIRNSRPPC